jgi:hypothetical protein
MTPTDITPPEDHETRVIVLSERQIDDIARRVEDRFYARVGRKLVERVLWAIGICVVAFAVWLNAKGLK